MLLLIFQLCVYLCVCVCISDLVFKYICQYHDMYMLGHDIKCSSLLWVPVRKRFEKHWTKFLLVTSSNYKTISLWKTLTRL